MHSKLAGQLSLHDMVTSVLQDTREKVAAEDNEKSEKVKKLLKHEKKEHHGRAPSAEEEEKEKKSSIIDPSDPDEVEKLASALEVMADVIESTEEKVADEKNLGKESPQGGTVLPVMSMVGGKQPYKKDSSKSHNVPAHTPEGSTKDNPGSSTATMTDEHSGKLLKYLHSKYPEKGPLKTAAASVKEMIEAKKKGEEKGESKEEEKKEKKSAAPPFVKKDEKKDEKKEKGEEKAEKEKKSQAVSFLLGKMAAFSNKEKQMGGETLDSPSEEGPKPASGSQGGNNVRNHIGSNQAAINMKKVEGKAPQKKMLSEVLTEPALSKAHDSKVHENLRNATKGGVKIAAAKAFLSKIAAEGCTCSGKGECKYCKMKKAMEKKSQGGMVGGAPPAAPAMTPPPMTGMR